MAIFLDSVSVHKRGISSLQIPFYNVFNIPFIDNALATHEMRNSIKFTKHKDDHLRMCVMKIVHFQVKLACVEIRFFQP